MGCDVCLLDSVWIEVVHKSEVKERREASGAGDMPLWCCLTSSSEVFQATNSRSVCCQPVGHLGGQAWHSTLWQHKCHPLPPTHFLLVHGQAGAPECTRSRHDRWAVMPLRREKNPSFLKVQWKVRSPVSLGELLTTLHTLTSTERRPVGSKRERDEGREQVEGWRAVADRWWGSNQSGGGGWQGQGEVERQVEVMGYRECVRVSWRLKSQCVRGLCLEVRWRRGGRRRCLALAALHHIQFFIHASWTSPAFFRSSWLSADNAIRVSLHVNCASMFRSLVKISTVHAPPQGRKPNEKSPGTTAIIK